MREISDRQQISGQFIILGGYDSTSNEYRRILVDETGKLQTDVVATIGEVPISGETVKLDASGMVVKQFIADVSGQRVIQNPNEVSGQVVRILDSTGQSGQWVRQNPAEVSGQVVRILDPTGLSGTRIIQNPAEISGQRVIQNPDEVSGQVVRILDPTGMSGQWVRQNPSEVSGQVVKQFPIDMSGQFVILNGYDSVSGAYRRLIVNAVGALVDKPYLYEIAQGRISGRASWAKIGFNGATGATEEDLIPQGGAYAWSTSSQQLMIKSSENGDRATGPVGSGAYSVKLYYLDNNFIPQSETIALNGTSGQNTVATNIYRVQNMRVASVGTNAAPLGNLSLTNLSGANTYGYITAGQTRMRQCVWTVPASTDLYITSVKISANPTTANKYTRFITRSTYDDKAEAQCSGFFMAHHDILTVEAPYTLELEMPTKLPQRTDLKVSAVTETGAGTATCALRGWTETG